MKSPTVIIDTREQTPLTFPTFPTETAKLPTGDYSVKGLTHSLTIERKSVPDLISSLTAGRDRFDREIQRMLAYPHRTLLIIGAGEDPRQTIRTHSYRSQAKPQSILGSLTSIQARGISVQYVTSPENAAKWIESVSWYSWRQAQIAAGNRPLVTPPEILAYHR